MPSLNHKTATQNPRHQIYHSQQDTRNGGSQLWLPIRSTCGVLREGAGEKEGYLGPTLTNCDSVDLGHVGFKRSLGDSDGPLH